MANLMKALTNQERKSSAAPAEPEVVAVARRRQITRSDKRRILTAADRCSKPAEIGALLINPPTMKGVALDRISTLAH